VPVVSINCEYKQPLKYGDSIIVESTYIPTAAAKLIFEYKILKPKTRELIAIGSSTQVFVDAKTFELHLINPTFFEEWKKKNVQ